MPKVRAPPSKRKSSRLRHKVERKKREHKRDVRKAAKAMRKSGLGPKRSKRQQEVARLALKVSNAHADKEKILSNVLQARETARVLRAGRKHGTEEAPSTSATAAAVPRPSSTRLELYIPAADASNFAVQFTRALHELALPDKVDATWRVVQELPCVAYTVTLDARCAVQGMPWMLLDAIVHQAWLRSRDGDGTRPVLLLFVLTKVDLVSAPALVSQVSLVTLALAARYASLGGLPRDTLVAAIAPFSPQFDCTARHLCRIYAQFEESVAANARHAKAGQSNMDRKVCAFVVGYPNSGRRTLCRVLASEANTSRVSVVPLRAAQLQFMRRPDADPEAAETLKFALPNAKAITLVPFAEDDHVRRELQQVVGADVFFCAPSVVERLEEPEAVACVLVDGVMDKSALAQAFCLPLPRGMQAGKKTTLAAAQSFLRELGKMVRREKGFYVSPLFTVASGTMSRTTSSSLTAHVNFTSGQQRSRATLLDASYSNATPSKLVRIAVAPTRTARKRNAAAQRGDVHHALRLGARTLVRELCVGGNIPWAVMRAPHKTAVSVEQVAQASQLFSLALSSGKRTQSDSATAQEHYNALIHTFATVLKPVLSLMPNNVLELDPDLIVAPPHELESEQDKQERLSASDCNKADKNKAARAQMDMNDNMQQYSDEEDEENE